MKWLRKLMGLDFPDPEVGQVWRSQHSGRTITVTEVYKYDSGDCSVTVQREGRNGTNPIPMTYCNALWEWRSLLREERRVLELQRHVPKPAPWPAPPPRSP